MSKAQPGKPRKKRLGREYALHANGRPYDRLLGFIENDLGRCFTDRSDNIMLLAEFLGWKPSQVYGVLGILVRQGVLSWSKADHAWTVVKGEEAA